MSGVGRAEKAQATQSEAACAGGPAPAGFAAAQTKRPEGRLAQAILSSPVLQARAADRAALEAGAPNRTGLPDQLKAGVEALSGVSLQGVRVHRNSDRPVQLGALAYAQGRDIHLGPGQEKHLPHEAWHIAQQAQGRVKPTARLSYGTPLNDDVGLEQEADAMGARALQLRPAREKSSRLANAQQASAIAGTQQRQAGPAGAAAPLQRKITIKDDAAAIYDPGKNPDIVSEVYKGKFAELAGIERNVDIGTAATPGAEALYIYNEDLSGNILIPPMIHALSTKPGQTEFHSNLGTLAHEMQHALDDLTRTVKFRSNNENVLHTEWRAWAVQAAVTLEHARAKKPVTFPDSQMLKCFKDKVTLSTPGSAFFLKTAGYLKSKGVIADPTHAAVIHFMRTRTEWLGEALELFYGNVKEGMNLDWETEPALQGKFAPAGGEGLRSREASPLKAPAGVVQRNAIIAHNFEWNENPINTIIRFVQRNTGIDPAHVADAIAMEKKYRNALRDEGDYKPISVKAFIDNVTGSAGRTTEDIQTAIGRLGTLEDRLRGRAGITYDGGHLLGHGWWDDWELIDTAENIAPQNRDENRSIFGFAGGWGKEEEQIRKIPNPKNPNDKINIIVNAYVNYSGGTYTVSLSQIAAEALNGKFGVKNYIEKMATAGLRFVVLNSRVPKQYVLSYKVLSPTGHAANRENENLAGGLLTAWAPTPIPRDIAGPFEDAVHRNLLPLWSSQGDLGRWGGAVLSRNHPWYPADAFADAMKLAQFGVYYGMFVCGLPMTAAAALVAAKFFGSGTLATLLQILPNAGFNAADASEYMHFYDGFTTTVEQTATTDNLIGWSKSTAAYVTSQAVNWGAKAASWFG
jgi:hypothetical protein